MCPHLTSFRHEMNMPNSVISTVVLLLSASALTDAYLPGLRLFKQIQNGEKVVEKGADSLAVRIISERVWAAEKELAAPSLPDLLKKLGLTTLLELVAKADLVPTLSGPGPFTVFGPNNEAFSNLPEWAKVIVANKTLLASVLEYHVLPVSFPSTSLKDELLVDTVLQGKQLRINIYTKTSNAVPTITAQCAPVDLSQVDQKASNGLLHVLKSVMIPPFGNIVETVAACPVFTTLVTAVKAAALVDVLSGDGPFTLFAPTDDAFKKLPPGTLDNLLKNITALQRVLEYHVVSLTYCSSGLATGLYSKITTLAKEDIYIDISDGVKVNNASVISSDGSVSNGVVHAIDTVLIPPDVQL